MMLADLPIGSRWINAYSQTATVGGYVYYNGELYICCIADCGKEFDEPAECILEEWTRAD